MLSNTLKTLGVGPLRVSVARSVSAALAARASGIGAMVLGLCVVVAGVLATSHAHAQATIKRPGAHPAYSFEAEPHLVISDRGHSNDAFGPGFRGTVVVVDNGFVSSINNSVGIGFGADFLLLGDDHCHGRDRCHTHDVIVLPVVMQWNFWLHKKWSVFGEPGLAFVLNEDHDNDDFDDTDLDIDPFVFGAGGRFHFNDSVTLTMRVGFPVAATIGVSFLL